MTAQHNTSVQTGRKKIARGKERSDAALGRESQNTSSPGGAKEGGQLPSGWEWKTIPDLISHEGVFIDGDWVESKDQDPNGDVRLIQLADVGDGTYRDKSDRFMTKAKADELRCTFLKDGDVLIARMPDPLGRACIFPGDSKASVTVVDVAIVRSGNGEFDHHWLACFVNAHPFRSAISGLQAGSTRKRISRGNLATIPLPVPPLPEQRRIVAEIEKQFTRLEAGVAALRRVQSNLKRYRAAVLKAAFDGEWPKKALKDCFKVSRGRFGYRPRNEPRFYNGPYPFVQIGDLPRDGGSIAKHTQTLNNAGLTISHLFPAGTVLIAIVGATIGNTGILTFDSCAPDSLVALESEDSILSKFAEFYLQSKKFEIRSTSYASGGQPNINLEFLRNYPFPLPPAAEQTRIVADVERRLSVVEELESVVSANLQRANRLRQSILQKAFTGELPR